MAQFFYNFCFPDDQDGFVNHGFYYLNQKEDLIYSHTEFNTPDGVYQNIFQVKFEQDFVTAYKHNDDVWMEVEAGQYPTSAYPLVLLLLSKAAGSSFGYLAISEDTGELLGKAVLEHSNDNKRNEIIETIESKITRRFRLQVNTNRNQTSIEVQDAVPDFVPISIDWGGATSFLCKDATEAVKGTNITISEDILSR